MHQSLHLRNQALMDTIDEKKVLDDALLEELKKAIEEALNDYQILNGGN